MTNDHYFATGPLRVLEEMYGPWTWATNVQFCAASGPVRVFCFDSSFLFPLFLLTLSISNTSRTLSNPKTW